MRSIKQLFFGLISHLAHGGSTAGHVAYEGNRFEVMSVRLKGGRHLLYVPRFVGSMGRAEQGDAIILYAGQPPKVYGSSSEVYEALNPYGVTHCFFKKQQEENDPAVYCRVYRPYAAELPLAKAYAAPGMDDLREMVGTLQMLTNMN